MAQLNNSLVSGSLRITDTLYSNNGNFNTIKLPNNGAYSAGSSGQVVMSDGTNSYWGTPGAGIELIVSTNTAASAILEGISENIPFSNGAFIIYLTTYPISEGNQSVSFSNSGGTTVTSTLYVANGVASSQGYAAGIFLPLIYYNNNFYVVNAFPTLPSATGVSF